MPQMNNEMNQIQEVEELEVLRGIASYLSLSDVESIGSLSTDWSSHMLGRNKRRSFNRSTRLTPGSVDDLHRIHNSVDDSHLAWLRTRDPQTPGLVALSPIPLDEEDEDYTPVLQDQKFSETEICMKSIQSLLKDEVFSHPRSIRSYCLLSHKTALKLRRKRTKELTTCPKCHLSQIYHKRHPMLIDPYTDLMKYCICEDPLLPKHFNSYLLHDNIINILKSSLFNSIPLSIIFDISYQSLDFSLQVTQSSASLTGTSVATIVQALADTVNALVHGIIHNLNPVNLIHTIIHLQRKAVGKTGEVIATGIQSVATGVFSKSGSFHVFGGAKSTNSPKSGVVSVATIFLLSSPKENIISDALFQKMNKIDPSSKVIKYVERDEEVLSNHAKKRVQRMMHYSLSLKPFTATIQLPEGEPQSQPSNNHADVIESEDVDEQNMENDSGESDSPFMATPKSFPPTPSSRAHVLARGSKYAENVVFLARDQLRVEEGMGSTNAQTRAMAKALREGRRLAVFNASDVSGIQLSRGQHSASKIGNDMYSTARGMIPILRNSFVYFEMSISTSALFNVMFHHASVSIGLSTLEMPLNVLVGQWNGSVGLCSTGQILAGNMIPPLNPKPFGGNSTVGCLVKIDDDSSFETWDGVMVTANVLFNVDGEIIVSSGVLDGGSSFPGISRDASISSKRIDTTQFTFRSNPFPALPICVPREEELYPTITIHSPQTEVLCRFCAQDILANSRNAIGAPRGSIVYAVDGSVLFDAENIDTDSDDSFDATDYDDFDDPFSLKSDSPMHFLS